MREIEFCFWDEEDNKMVYDEPYASRHSFLITPSGAVFYPDGTGKHRKGKLRQYTGLKDKKGKKIYGGDIDISGLVVAYSGDQREGLGMNVGWYLQRDDFQSFIEIESRCNENGDNYEIIGNIYENPELLNAK